MGKGDGSVRMCMDYYRWLSRVTVTDAFPIPRIYDLNHKVSGMRFLTKIDLKGFY